MAKLVALEYHSPNSVPNRFLLNYDGHLEVVSSTPRFTSVSNAFRSVFLPQGYPESVSSDYLQYQIWDTIQAFSSSITGTLATQAVLKGVGVGDESATILSATITWMLKDGTGKLGQILFAWMQGSALDCECKRWRLFADVLNDLAIFLDIIAPLFNSYFRLIICVAGVCRSIVGVAGGATRAALTQHQARRNNMADVSAKDGSQETLVSLAALVCSLVIMNYVTGNQSLIWVLYILLTFLHLFANYKAVRSVCMETFNQARFHIVVADWLLRMDPDQVIGVGEANRYEPVLWGLTRRLQFNLGTSLRKLAERWPVNLEFVLSLYKDSRYLLVANAKSVDIVLHVNADYTDQLKACYHAEVINFCVSRASSTMPTIDHRLHNITEAYKQGDGQLMLRLSNSFVCETYSSLSRSIETAGWKTTPVQLGSDEWRSDWTSMQSDSFHNDITNATPKKLY